MSQTTPLEEKWINKFYAFCEEAIKDNIIVHPSFQSSDGISATAILLFKETTASEAESFRNQLTIVKERRAEAVEKAKEATPKAPRAKKAPRVK